MVAAALVKAPPIPTDEADRIRALRELRLLDTPPEERFDIITRLARSLLGVPISLVSLVDEHRQWFKSRQGLDVTETPRDISFCGHAVVGDDMLIVADATRDSRFADNPLVTSEPRIRFYAGQPLREPGGARVGTLCVIDRQPRILDSEQHKALKDLARLVEGELSRQSVHDIAEQLAATTHALQGSNRALVRERGHTLTVLEQLGVGAIVLDDRERVEFVSECCKACLSIDDSDARHWTEVLPLPPRARADVRRCLDTPERERDIVHSRVGSGADQHWIEIDVRDAPSGAGRHILYVTDVTELHELRSARGSTAFPDEGNQSHAMERLFDDVAKVARGNWTVLITGETGSGKERVARAIHALSSRRKQPFIAVNCAGVPASLLESQLFGYVRGAFTGAADDRKGVFEAASGGTLFLDEVGDMPLAMQTALLRVLQENEVVRLGEHVPRKIDARVVLATHRDLEVAVDQGLFRADLLYRIRVGRIVVPALRSRRDDIPALAKSFLAAAGTSARYLDSEAVRLLQAHSWPGNVRELKAAVEFAAIRCSGATIGANDLPPEVRDAARPDPVPGETQRTELLEALARAGGNRAQAARLLGIGRATFYRRLTKYGLDRPPQDLER